MKYILGYSRSQSRGGEIVTHHLNTVCNTLCVARRQNTMIYVFQAIDHGEVCESVEVQPKRMGVSDGGGYHPASTAERTTDANPR